MKETAHLSEVMSAEKCCYRFYCLTEWRAGKSGKDIHQRLLEVWGEKAPGYSTVKRWIQKFKEHDDLDMMHMMLPLKDESRSGRPRSSMTDENIATLSDSIKEDPRSSLRTLAATTGIPRETVRHILVTELNLRKVCSTWIPHKLSDANKELRVNCAKQLRSVLSELGDDASHVFAVEDESWFFFQAQRTKQENMVWLPRGAARPQVQSPTSMTDKKTLVLLVFTCDKKLSLEALPYGTTIDSQVYIDFCRKTGDRWRVLRKNPANLKFLRWQHDNARAHTSAKTKNFFQNRGVSMIFQSPYSPDFNLCDRWLFRELKKRLGTVTYKSHDEIEEAIKRAFHSIPEETFSKQIHHLFDYCQAVIDNHGDYVSDMY